MSSPAELLGRDGEADADRDRDPDEPERHICSKCGKEFASARGMRRHRTEQHGGEGGGGSSSAGGTAPRISGRQTKRAQKVRETIDEFLDFREAVAGEAGDAQVSELRQVIRRDAAKIADSVAWAAERFNPLGVVVDRFFGHGGPITFARGFLGVGAWLARKWRGMLEQRRLETDEQVWTWSEDEQVWFRKLPDGRTEISSGPRSPAEEEPAGGGDEGEGAAAL